MANVLFFIFYIIARNEPVRRGESNRILFVIFLFFWAPFPASTPAFFNFLKMKIKKELRSSRGAGIRPKSEILNR
jgi:hypothetical protein